MTKLQYNLETNTAKNATDAKISEVISSQLGLRMNLPAMTYQITTSEELNEAFLQDVQTLQHCQGQSINLLDANNRDISGINLTWVHGMPEIFYYTGTEESQELAKKILPSEFHDQLEAIWNSSVKRQAHRKLWEKIWNSNQTSSVISNYSRISRVRGAPFITTLTPYLRNEEDIDHMIDFYDRAVDLYSTDESLKPNPERVLLELNISNQLLKKDGAIKALIQEVKDLSPEAIAVRLPNLGDIRDLATNQKRLSNWRRLIDELSVISVEDEVPLLYAGSADEAPFVISLGVDIVSVRPTKEGELRPQSIRLPSELAKQMHRDRPYLTSGSIRRYGGTRGYMTRETFHEEVKDIGAYPYPFEPLALGYSNQELLQVNNKKFRSVARRISAQVFTQEIFEVRQAIQQGKVEHYKNKLGEWMGTSNLLP